MTREEAAAYIAAGKNARERQERQELFDAGQALGELDSAAWMRRRQHEDPTEVAESIKDGRARGSFDRWGEAPPPKDPNAPAED